jgi:hypothetical protein
MMTMDEIRKYKRAEPFQPFVIHTDDGRQFRVFHHYNVALSPTGRAIAVAVENEDAFETLHVSQVAHISLMDDRKAG